MYVLITTKHRGVFAGEEVRREDRGREITLKDARNAIYWATTRGFIELAEDGPNENSKIGAVADEIQIFDVTSIVKCSEKGSAYGDGSGSGSAYGDGDGDGALSEIHMLKP